MTIVLAVILLVAVVGAAGAAHPRTRHLFLQKKVEPKALPSHSSAEVEQWKQIFRETVISADGQLSPEMEEFLMNDDERVTVFLAGARKAAEEDRAAILKKATEDRAEILKKAEEDRAEILKENENWTGSKRPPLVGAAYREYLDDREGAQTRQEAFDVIKRWHIKGFRFPAKLRAELLKKTGVGEEGVSTRNDFRKWFDEQDKPSSDT